MTIATIPALPTGTGHFLISADGTELIRFSDAGDHQMLMNRFVIEADEWVIQSGGFNWIGIMRQRYQTFTAKGYRKIG
jgi:hypothetical protein